MVIEAGQQYTGIVQDVRCEKNDNDNMYIAIRCDIEGEDETAYLNLYLTPKTMKHTLKKLKMLGFNNDYADPVLDVEEIDLIASYETYDSVERIKWEIAGFEYGTGTALTNKDIAKLNAMVKQSGGDSTPSSSLSTETPREAAWKAFEERAEGTRKEQSKAWFDLIGTYADDKEEKDFTAEDWKGLKSYIEVGATF